MSDEAGVVSMLGEPARRKVLGLIGLGARGRLLVVGAERVAIEAGKGKVVLAVVASDVSRHSLEKVVPVLRAPRIETVELPRAAGRCCRAGYDSGDRDCRSSAGARYP